ncbi:MAG: Crp/Fnr family transcriptional regulator [Rhodocyclales bacterium]|nr:Crp/Fnr family transcriptional regulator [Rhodocyclales bacterium]
MPHLIFAEHAVIYRQREKVAAPLLIDTGLVCLRRLFADGRVVVIDIVGAREVIGNLSAPSAWSATEEAVALNEVRCTRLLSAATENGAVPVPDARLVQALIRRESRLKDRLVSQVNETVEQRVIRILCDLSSQFNVPCSHGYSLEILLTQQELADIVCASRPVVSQVLNRFKEQGLLDYTAQQLCVRPELLRRRVEVGDAWVSADHC